MTTVKRIRTHSAREQAHDAITQGQVRARQERAEREADDVMKGTCELAHVTFGGNGGEPFLPVAPFELSMRADGWIDAVILNGRQYGGNGGGARDVLQFRPGEYVNRVVIGAGRFVDRLEFYTNLEQSISGGDGRQGGRPSGLDNVRVLRIGGRSGQYLDRHDVTYCADYRS